MKQIQFLLFLAVTALQLLAFEWPGGVMSIPYVFAGEEAFAGRVPSSPWGSTAFLQDPAVELRDSANQIILIHTATGGPMDWRDGGTRAGTATFSVPAGTYSVTTREGRRLIRIAGEGWTGFKLVAQSITEPTPPNGAPTIAWSIAPVMAGNGQSYTVSAHGHDDDGNLAQVNVWKDGQPFAFGGGGNGFDSDSGNATSDPGPQTITFTAQAVDGAGASSAVISHTVTIDPPAPVQYTLNTSAGSGGSVSAGGTFNAGTVVAVSAAPDGLHDFVGWSGDAGGAANPLSVTVNANLTVVANFAPKSYALTTNAMSGGNVTPGGSYPFGTTVTISANPDALHYFIGWSGDASGGAPSISVLIDRVKFVQANFAAKVSQAITFDNPGSRSIGASFPLVASATSGLPVSFQIMGGPASLSGNTLTVLGSGAISVQALQAGDATTLPAAPVAVSFNATAPVVLKYRPAARTILRHREVQAAANYVIGNP